MNTALHDHGPLRALRNTSLFFVVLGLLFVAVELALVPVVNRALDGADDTYALHIDDIELKPWSLGWTAEGLTVRLRADPDREPLLEVDTIDAALDGAALLQGRVIGAITLDGPTARFESRQTTLGSRGEVIGVDRALADLLRGMLPVNVDKVVVQNGVVTFVTDVALPAGGSKALDLRITDLALTADNLTNSAHLTKPLFGTVTATANAEGYGALRTTVHLDPTAAAPTFDLDASVTGIALPALNEWASAFGRFTFDSGSLDVFTEVSAKDGRFRGFVQPLAHNVEMVTLHRDIGSKLVGGIVDGAARVLTNPKAARGAGLPFSGTFAKLDAASLDKMLATLKTALFDALAPLLQSPLLAPHVQTVLAMADLTPPMRFDVHAIDDTLQDSE